MTTNRSYRAAMPVADAVAELDRCAGAQFDPEVVQALVRMVAKHPEHRPARALLELAA
jgi:HD-GYP domain-containing protein (c-di-GMP phosphodiesterase class II)